MTPELRQRIIDDWPITAGEVAAWLRISLDKVYRLKFPFKRRHILPSRAAAHFTKEEATR